ncbi:hypothetical protein MRY82_06555 [bacterium]|nr:hypothetical protein [bacterium]
MNRLTLFSRKKLFVLSTLMLSVFLSNCGFQVAPFEEEESGMWTHPSSATDYISIEGPSYFVSDHQVVMNSSGETLIVWRQYDGLRRNIYMSQYRNGLWTHPQNITDYLDLLSTYNVDDVHVALDDAGDAIIIWSHYNGTEDNYYKAEYRNGVWSFPADLNDYFNPSGTGVSDADLAMDNNGNAIIAWTQDDGLVDRVYKSEYRNGSWMHPANLMDAISPVDTDVDEGPMLDMNDSGEIVIAWLQEDLSSDLAVYFSEYRNGSWDHPAINEAISPDLEDVLEEDYLRVALSDNGEAIIAWIQDNDVDDHLFFSEYRNGSWNHPSAGDYISLDDYNAERIELDMDAQGNTIIVWEQSSPDGDSVFLSHYQNGAWTHPVDENDAINPGWIDPFYSGIDTPNVAMDSEGNAVVAWEQNSDINDPQEEPTNQIFFSEYINGVWYHPSSATDTEYVISKAVGHSRDAKVARSDNGEAMIVWEQSDGMGNDFLFFSEYRK